MPAGEPGELAIRGPQVMEGYWKMPGETAGTIIDELPETNVGKVLRKDLRAMEMAKRS